MHIDIANREALAGLNRLDSPQTFPERFWQDALQRVHGRPGHEKWRLPESEDLRQAVAVIGVLVSNQDGVEAVNVSPDGREARQSFTLSEAGVHKDAGASGFEQRQVARTAGRKNGSAQADGNSPRKKPTPAKLSR
jgi:hypothetical protein